eukprot:scaffold508_cov554-Prasinococcus_capsulatus_cf.AAC.11
MRPCTSPRGVHVTVSQGSRHCAAAFGVAAVVAPPPRLLQPTCPRYFRQQAGTPLAWIRRPCRRSQCRQQATHRVRGTRPHPWSFKECHSSTAIMAVDVHDVHVHRHRRDDVVMLDLATPSPSVRICAIGAGGGLIGRA